MRSDCKYKCNIVNINCSQFIYIFVWFFESLCVAFMFNDIQFRPAVWFEVDFILLVLLRYLFYDCLCVIILNLFLLWYFRNFLTSLKQEAVCLEGERTNFYMSFHFGVNHSFVNHHISMSLGVTVWRYLIGFISFRSFIHWML